MELKRRVTESRLEVLGASGVHNRMPRPSLVGGLSKGSESAERLPISPVCGLESWSI
jgi:hypothetical protein